ncbi:beta-1,4-galactosyltransferase 3-like isoform X1 [Varanus komodoensis]|uniref:Beta-1,4-galactosyltransferase n=1 Tax=Varanus komodoensis TaxID=61221 RepID=A0A8D2IWX0_VARKO|nr:beta-1,4-galactosyltransferase 3-like isoform X1 [Varanus komodoensis]
MAIGKTMSLTRVENPCFLMFLIIAQAIFILILYRGRTSVEFKHYFDQPKQLDYSVREDVYTNLSLYTHAPDKMTIRYCTPQSPIHVGPLTITFDTVPSERTIISKNPYVQSGGCYSPPHCLARYKIAVIVPYRNCEKQLHHFLYYIHPFLQRQQLNYCIYLIHQAGTGPFNRAKLLNIGVREALKDEDWDCLLLHDIDLIPENDYNYYICDDYYPKHMATAIDSLQSSLPHRFFFGGVIALTPEHYMKINGFPNTYWDRDGNDDIAERIQIVRMKIVRSVFGRYKKVDNGQASGTPEYSKRSASLHTRKTWKDDGMNSLDFKLLSKQQHPLYMNISVDIGVPPMLPPQGMKKQSHIL